VSGADRQRKTYVAVEAARRAMDENRTVILHVPAESGFEYQVTEFSKIFAATASDSDGDRQDNSQAPIPHHDHGNSPQSALRRSQRRNRCAVGYVGLVILDESQYLRIRNGVSLGGNHHLLSSRRRLAAALRLDRQSQDIADWLTSSVPHPAAWCATSKRTVLSGGLSPPQRQSLHRSSAPPAFPTATSGDNSTGG